jgi:hypothetical protein
MPTGTINIYIDNSFLSTVSGATNVKIDYPVLQADNLGEGISPIFYTVSAGISGTQNIETNLTISSSGTTTSGFTSTDQEFILSTLTSGIGFTCLVDYSFPITSSGLSKNIDFSNAYFTGYFKSPGFQTYKTQFLAGRSYPYFTSTSLRYLVSSKVDTDSNLVSNYTSPEELFNYKDTLIFSTFSGSLITGGGVNAFADVFFAGYVFNTEPFQVICGLRRATLGSTFDAELVSGHVKHEWFQVITGIESNSLISDFDLYAGAATSGIVNFDLETIDGRIAFLDFDLYSGVSGVNGYTFDVDLLSIKISDLSIDDGEYVNATGTLCVDVTDDIYNIVTGGCYFIIDGTIVSGTFTPITDGYRMCYNPVDDFASVLGVVEFQAVAENDNGDILTKSFYLTSGYSVEYDNIDQDYGWGNKITIRMSAENFASCPAVGVFAYEVESVFKESRDYLLLSMVYLNFGIRIYLRLFTQIAQPISIIKL